MASGPPTCSHTAASPPTLIFSRPLLEPFRRIIPSLGGIDISPIVVILLLQFVSVLFNRTAGPALVQMLG